MIFLGVIILWIGKNVDDYETLKISNHDYTKNWSFPSRVFAINMTKSAVFWQNFMSVIKKFLYKLPDDFPSD